MKKTFSSSPRFLLAVLAVLVTARCGNNKASASAAVAAVEEAIPVRVAAVTSVAYVPPLRYSGSTASASEARLSFKIGGMVRRIYVKEGDQVKKGQLLASLDPTEIDAQVRQATEAAEKARRDVKRIGNLYRDTVASLEQLQNVTTQQQVAEEGLRIARFNQQHAQIMAAEDGTILKKLMNEGETASAGAPVFYLAGTSPANWIIRFGVSDKDWVLLKKGDRATVLLDAYPDKAFTGVITEIATGADPAGGTYQVEVKLVPDGRRLATGLFGTIQLHTAAKSAVTMVPIEALTEGDGSNAFVYTVNEDHRTVARRTVAIAFLEKDRAAIRNGLENVKEIVTDGAGYLTEKSIVKIIR